ncbi:PTS sugar transporter subunit IIA [bacterium]|nr:PTS sugar transporter subunit IIA [bacterium]
MDFKIKDVAAMLQVSEKTVYRWIKEKKIPCYRIQHQYRFNRAEINEWVLSNKIELSSNLLDLKLAGQPTNFTYLLAKGGIHSGIPGTTVAEVLHNALEMIPKPAGITIEEIAGALLNREQMMSTAIGHGIAIPHPRNPIVTTIEDASVSICFLEQPVDFGALDGKPVHTLFVLLTISPRRHLEVLSKISHLCQIEAFRVMLENRVPERQLLDYIREKESGWQQKIAGQA